MAISIDYGVTNVITIPKADLVFITGTLYELDTNAFRLELKDIEDGEIGIAFPKTHTHNTEVTVAGTTFARVLEIVAPYSVEFENGTYSVRLNGSNNNVFDVENGILVQNNVLVISNNSAGLTNLAEIRSTAYNGEISIDPVGGEAGTLYPIGTRKYPVNNIADAHLIALFEGIRTFKIISSITIANEDLSEGHSFIGDSPFIGMTVEATANVSNCDFSNLFLMGALGLNSTIRECQLLAVTGVSGIFEKCAFGDEVTIAGDLYIFESYSHLAGNAYPTFVCGSNNITFRTYGGSIGLKGTTAGHNSSCGIYGGRLIVEASCVGGFIHARGDPYEIADSSGAGCTVYDQTANQVSIITTMQAQIDELHILAGLSDSKPVYIPAGAGTIAATGIDIDVGGDCDTGHTLTRQ